MLISEHYPLVLVSDLESFDEALTDEINHLTDAHEDAQHTGGDHKQHEDLFLSRTANEAVHGVRARIQ